MGRWTGLLGIAVLIGAALLVSNNRRRVRPRIVIGGILLQVVLAFFVLRVPQAEALFDGMAHVATRVLRFTDQGAAFIFGTDLYTNKAAGFIFAIHVLPTIIFFASLMTVLYHLGIMQLVVRAMAFVMGRTMGVTGAESLAVAANVFVGQTEAPLVIKPYIPKMTQSELMTLMTGGFATIAGSVFAAYVAMLGGDDPARCVLFAKHLLAASVMSAPAAFVVSKIMVPETQESVTAGHVRIRFEKKTINLLDAATSGATDGLRLAANVAAMLLALLALLAGVDYVLTAIGEISWIKPAVTGMGMDSLCLKNILGLLFSPLAWTLGADPADIRAVGSLLGEKLVLTEFVAYGSLADMIHQQPGLSPKSTIIATYALCGFANFGSIAIQLGGIGSLAPQRRGDLARLGLRAMLAGAMASFMTAAIAGILVA